MLPSLPASSRVRERALGANSAETVISYPRASRYAETAISNRPERAESVNQGSARGGFR